MFLISLLTPAFAQDATTFDAHGFALAPLDGDVRDGLEVPRPGRFVKGQWWAGGLLEFAKAPLVYVTDAGIDPRLDNVFGLNTSFGYAVHDLVRLDAALPLYFTSSGPDGGNGVAIGDARIGAMIAAIQPDEDDLGIGLGVAPFLTLPTGTDAAYLGDSSVGGGGSLAVSYALTKLTVGADLGVEFRPAIALNNLNGSDRLLYGVSLNYLAAPDLGITAEARMHSPFKSGEVAGTQFPAEFRVSGRKRLESGGFFLLGASGPLSSGAGTATFRVFAGGGFGKPAHIDRDTDLDGFLDSVDTCPTDAETKNGWKDEDGCPDKLAQVDITVNQDGVAITDATVVVTPPAGAVAPTGTSFEVMPGTTWDARATKGTCMAGSGTVTTVEGPNSMVIDIEPVLGTTITVEVVDGKGKPVPEATAAWEGAKDPCVPNGALSVESGSATTEVGAGPHRSIVTAPGFKNVITDIVVEAGVPQTVKVVLTPTKVKVTAEKIVILDKVFFETNKDVIKTVSYELLDDVAGTIIANPQLVKIEVDGHTDADGVDAANLDLSQRRAESVVRYLVAKGVGVERFVPVGFGETKPIDSNKTATGKANNRRVEFVILETAPVE